MSDATQPSAPRWLRGLLLAGSVPAGLLVVWVALTASGTIEPLFLPQPASVWESFVSAATEGYRGASLWEHLGISLARVLGACAVAVLVAVPLGLVVGRHRTAAAVVGPVVNFYRVLPPLAYYTLLVLWLGIGEMSKWTLLALAGFPPVFIAVVHGVQSIPADRLAAARMLGARGLRLYRSVVVPSVLPDIFTGIRVAVGFTYTTLVAAEMVAAGRGIGWMVLDASKYLRTDVMWMGIIIMGLTGVVLDWAIGWLSRRAVRWPAR